MKGRAGLWLLGNALVSESVYLAATVRLPWWKHARAPASWRRLLDGSQNTAACAGEAGGFGACIAGVSLLLLAYVGCLHAARREVNSAKMVWAGALLFSVTLVWLLPMTSDLLGYLGQARLMTDLGMNPLLNAVAESPSARMFQSYNTVYSATPSNYGPAWILLASVGTLGRNDSILGLLYLKLIGLAAYLCSVWLLSSILAVTKPQMAGKGMVLFAWNPLVLLMAVGDGHNDVVMMALVLLVMWLSLHRRWVLAAATLVLSIWVKYVSVILLPLFLLYAFRSEGRVARGAYHCSLGFRRRLLVILEGLVGSTLLRSSLAAGVVSVLVLVPFGGLAWLPRAGTRLLQPQNVLEPFSSLSQAALSAGIASFLVAYGIVVFWFARGTNSFDRLADAGFGAVLLAFLLGSARSQPWHLLWAAALAPLSGYRWAPPVIAGLSALMLAGQIWVEWGAPGLGV